MHDRAARRQVVRGRSGGRRDDEAVGLDVADELPVDVHVDLDHARQRAARDDDVVEGERGRRRVAPRVRSAAQHQPRFDVRAPGEQRPRARSVISARPTSVRKPSRPRLMPSSGTSPGRVARPRCAASSSVPSPPNAMTTSDADRQGASRSLGRPAAVDAGGRRAVALDDRRASARSSHVGGLDERVERAPAASGAR